MATTWGDSPLNASPSSSQSAFPSSEGRASDGTNGSSAAPVKFTESEVAALKELKVKVDRSRNLGFFVGAGVATLIARRRQPPLSLIALGSLGLAGGIGGSLFFIPVGIYAGRKALSKVEDPQHMAQAMKGAVEERRGRSGAFKPVAGPDGRKSDIFDTLNASSDRTADSQPSFSSDTSDTSASQSFAYGSPSTSSSTASNPSSAASPTTGSEEESSRWAQLRAQRNVQASSWDRIRQDNAREKLKQGQQRQPNETQDSFGTPRRGADQSLADPTFGKGSSRDRDRERALFEANMERERRGLDSGLDMSGGTGTGGGGGRW